MEEACSTSDDSMSIKQEQRSNENVDSMKRNRSVRESKLHVSMEQCQCPVVYASEYNIRCFGLEKMHPFDAHKWGNIHRLLVDSGKLSPKAVVKPREASKEDLLVVHSKRYLDSLKCSARLAKIVEVPTVACIPNCIVDSRLLCPMRFQTGGTILAAELALTNKWAINIGGGFHHASKSHGGGFCVYADISLALQFLFSKKRISNAMIIDLDAHQGNGHENDFMDDDRVYIFDMFNSEIYPRDSIAKEGIKRMFPLRCGCSDAIYHEKLKQELRIAFNEFTPKLVIYNAGTDSLDRDPLGLLQLSAEEIIKRDEFVFRLAARHDAPIVMVTSGGYLRESAKVVADSILNLHEKGLIQLK